MVFKKGTLVVMPAKRSGCNLTRDSTHKEVSVNLGCGFGIRKKRQLIMSLRTPANSLNTRELFCVRTEAG